MHVAGLDGLMLKKAPTLIYVTVASAGTFDVTIPAVDTSRAGIAMPEVYSQGISTMMDPWVAGYWQLLNSTVARFNCSYALRPGRQVEAYLYEFASGRVFEVQQSLVNPSAGILGTETTVAPYDYKHAMAFPRATLGAITGPGFKYTVYPYSPTQVRWIHTAQAAITYNGYATVFARA